MISKAVRGRGFSGAISYICEKSDHIRTLNIASENWKHAAREMHAVAALNATKKCVYHHWLSFSPDERLDDEQMFAAAEKMIEKLGLADHQHVMALHKDRDHLHVHIVSNLVSFSGKAAKLSHDFRARPVMAREIENELGLKAFERKQREPKEKFPPQKIAAIQAAARTGGSSDLERVLRELGVTMSEKSSRSKAVTYTFTDQKTGARIAGNRIDPSLSSPSSVKRESRKVDPLWQLYEKVKAQHPTHDEKTQKSKIEAMKKRHQSERKSIRDEQFAIRKEMLTDARRLRLPQPDHDAIKAVSAARLAKALEVLEIRHREERKIAAARFPTFREWLRTQSVTDLPAAVRLYEMGEQQPETVATATIDGLEFTIYGDGTVDFRDEEGRLLFTNTRDGVRFIQHDDYQLRERAIVAGLRVEIASSGQKFEFGSDPKVREEIIEIAGRNGLRLPGLTKQEEEDWKNARDAKPAAPTPPPAATPAAAKAEEWHPQWTAAIQEAVGRSTNAHELVSELSKVGISIEEVKRANGSTGVAFSKDGLRSTGSSLNRDLSWQKIGETLADNRHRQMASQVDDNDEIDARLDFEIMQRDMASQRGPAAKLFNRIASAARQRAPLIEAAKFAAAANLSARERRRFTPSPGAQRTLTIQDIESEIVGLFRSPSRPRLHSMDLMKQIHDWASKGLLTAQANQANLAKQHKETINVGRNNDGR